MPVVSRESHHPILAFPEHLTDTTVRLVAGGVSAAILGAYALRAGWVLPVLALGFVLRAIAGPRFSLLARAAILVTAFGVVLVRGIRAATRAPLGFDAYLAIGATALVVVPAVFNLLVATGLLPTKGLPLPFVSYGGSNLVATLAAVGLLLRIERDGRAATAWEQAT